MEESGATSVVVAGAGTDDAGGGGAGALDTGAGGGEAAVTGQIVVEIAMTEVTTCIELAGQLVTVGAQLVIVISVVLKMVEVVKGTPAGTEDGASETERLLPADGDSIALLGAVPTLEATEDGATATLFVDGDGLAGGLDAGLQSNPMLWMPISQGWSPPCSGIWNATDFAPPHCVFWTVDPAAEHDAVCLHVDPSGMS